MLHDNVLSKALTGADSLSTLLTDPDGPATAVVRSASYPSMNSKSPPGRALYCDVSQLASSHLIQCGTGEEYPNPRALTHPLPQTPPNFLAQAVDHLEVPQLCGSVLRKCVRMEERGLWHGVAEGRVQISQTFNLCFALMQFHDRRQTYSGRRHNHPVANQGSIPSTCQGTERLAFKLRLQFQAQKTAATHAVSAATILHSHPALTRSCPVDAIRFQFESPGAIYHAEHYFQYNFYP